MKKLFLLGLLVFVPAHAGTAFFSHEIISGMNKICFYDHMGSSVAITIGSNRLCPLTITV